MAQSTFSNDDFDKMKADAIRRARQMHSRTVFNNAPSNPPQSKTEVQESAKHTDTNTAEGILGLSKMLGISSDQLIIFALIFLLSQQKENLPLVIALLYIAM